MLVVIPAYQPDEKLKCVVEQINKQTEYPIIIVDDGSSAECQPLFAELENIATVLHHDVNKGKGRAMKTAFSYIYENYPHDEGIITVDADGQHLPADIISVCNMWLDNRDALVTGSRRFSGKVPFRSRAGNAITRSVFAAATGKKVYDTQTGLRAFSVSLIPTMIELKGERYEYEITQLLHCTRYKIPIIEVPIDTVYIKGNESSHFHAFRDSWRIYKIILMFISSSLLSFFLEWALANLINLFIIEQFTALSTTWRTLLATGVPRVLSCIFNYYLNRRLVFESNDRNSFWRFSVLAVLIYGLHYGLTLFFGYLFGPSLFWLSMICAQLIAYPITFVLQRKYVFKYKKKDIKE
ncbi:MAG: bifunctional glycosyltransferase family 2/GtrA family protein [Eubacteriales bacterium]|nr:bifunctional glycosyltransferase family 2/GtrA family protein [Eubacteriales bacterium]